MDSITTLIKALAVCLSYCYRRGKENDEIEYLNKISKKEVLKELCFIIIIV